MTTTPITKPTAPPEKGSTATLKALAGAGEHWFEMTATLCPQASDSFARWMDEQLALAESDLSDFASPHAFGKASRA